MNIKQVIKQIIPPLFYEIYKKYKNGFKSAYIWEGIYQQYKDVPTVGNNYFEKNLAKETLAHTKSLLKSLKRNKYIPYHINVENTFLPLVSTLILEEKKKIGIIDFGGGTGIGFISLISCIENIENIDALDYYVIETPAMCKEGSRLFKDDKRIRFLDDFPDKLLKIDMIFINSALQYFENYSDTLQRLSAYNPQYFLFVKFSAGEIPTYATCQKNLSRTTGAYWFLNIEEITTLMSSLGYSLIYKSSLERTYNQDNFPFEYRLKRACNLLFIRN